MPLEVCQLACLEVAPVAGVPVRAEVRQLDVHGERLFSHGRVVAHLADVPHGVVPGVDVPLEVGALGKLCVALSAGELFHLEVHGLDVRSQVAELRRPVAALDTVGDSFLFHDILKQEMWAGNDDSAFNCKLVFTILPRRISVIQKTYKFFIMCTFMHSLTIEFLCIYAVGQNM